MYEEFKDILGLSPEENKRAVEAGYRALQFFDNVTMRGAARQVTLSKNCRPDTQPTQPKGQSHLGSNGEAGGRLAPKAANPSSLAQPAFRRQAPEVRAVCLKVHVRIRAGGAG